MKLLLALLMTGSVGLAQAQVNTVYGQQAAASETSSSADISVFGYQAMYATQYGYGSSAFGYQVLRVSSGYYNTAMGVNSMVNATSGSYNTALGAYTLTNLGTGYYNVAVGYNAGSCATVNGSNNIWINHCGLAKDSNVIRIGTQGTQKFTQIAGIRDSKVVGGWAVVVDAKGHLGYAVAKAVPNVAVTPLTAADAMSFTNQLADLRAEIKTLKAQVASLHASH